MDKTKKIITGVIATVAIVAVIICVMVTTGDKTETVNKPVEQTTIEETTMMENLTVLGGETETSETKKNKNNKKNDKKKDKETTNFWDTVEIIEETDAPEVVTDKNGETVTESYPGENSGWSPIVSPEDLEKNE